MRSRQLKKLFIPLLALCIARFGANIPLFGIDQEALRISFSHMEKNNSIAQIVNFYTAGNAAILNPFSLGIIPFVNASMIIDLIAGIFPSLEQLQSEEGEAGKKTLASYKKMLTLILALIQSCLVLFYLRPYFYYSDFYILQAVGLQLTAGAMASAWLSNVIENNGIGNGVSLLIFASILSSLVEKKLISQENLIYSATFFLFLVALICIAQTARVCIEIVSARQLDFLEKSEAQLRSQESTKILNSNSGRLSIKLNQAGVFPIIVASNLSPFLFFLFSNFFAQTKSIDTLVYYFFLVSCNYFCTIAFWDPEKVSEQLRKASISIPNVTPGKQTAFYLENMIRSTSILGGVALCSILFFYNFSQITQTNSFLEQLNVSSLIIAVGVAYETQKSVCSLYKSDLEEQY